MNNNLFRFITLGLAAGALTLAQDGPPDAATMAKMRVDRISQQIKLTASQKTQATSLFAEAQTASQSMMAGMRDAQQSLAAAIKANDAGAIAQAANTIGTLTVQMTVSNAKAEAAFYSTLTADQQAQYTPSAGGGMRGPGGPGGPRGQGRFGPPPQE